MPQKTVLRKHHDPFESLNEQSFLNCLSFLQALRAYTVKRKILRRAQINVLAVLARKIFPADDAALQKHHLFVIQNAGECVNEFFDIVVAAYAEDTLLSVVFQPEPQQKNEFFFFNAGKPERFFV
jgi:hypothetical protein